MVPFPRLKKSRGGRRAANAFSLAHSKTYDDLESASSASAEEIELSVDEGKVQDEQHLDWLFPMDIFLRVLLKATAILGVKATSEERSG